MGQHECKSRWSSAKSRALCSKAQTPTPGAPWRANCLPLSHPLCKEQPRPPPRGWQEGGRWLYPMGGILDLTDHSLGISLERAGDHDEADELEVALQGLPLDLPGLWMDTPGP